MPNPNALIETSGNPEIVLSNVDNWAFHKLRPNCLTQHSAATFDVDQEVSKRGPPSRNDRLKRRKRILNHVRAGFRPTVRVSDRTVMSSSWPNCLAASAMVFAGWLLTARVRSKP